MEKTIIIGGGLLGKELHKNLKKQNIDSQIIKNVNYKKNNNIPKSTNTVIITSQSSDYRNPTFTTDLLYVNTILPMQIMKEAYEKNVEKIIYCSTGSVYKPKLKAHKETDKISIKNQLFNRERQQEFVRGLSFKIGLAKALVSRSIT